MHAPAEAQLSMHLKVNEPMNYLVILFFPLLNQPPPFLLPKTEPGCPKEHRVPSRETKESTETVWNARQEGGRG